MDKAQQASQLRLAAVLLETGHPWEWQSSDGEWIKPTIRTELRHVISDGLAIRPILATPPDNRPLHNPDNLTAEQVGAGYRLLCAEDGVPIKKMDTWLFGTWCSAYVVDKQHLHECKDTYRLPLSVPWPDAKPDTPPFQLPPPPPGMRWHRTDGWEEGDLPQGWRPLVLNEQEQVVDQWFGSGMRNWHDNTSGDNARCLPHFNHRRTQRPLAFTHAGKQWTWHRPGDPMPCDGERRIHIICHEGRTEDKTGCRYVDRLARNNLWKQTLGWRYADEKKTVPQLSTFFLPGTVIRFSDATDLWGAITAINQDGLVVGDTYQSYQELATSKAMANRSIPLTGKWNPDAWEPCSKSA